MRSLVALLAWVGSHLAPLHVGRGTVFGPFGVDRDAGSSHACDFPRRRLTQSATSRALEARGHVVAHRRLPCWSVLTVCSASSLRCTLATVADVGPARAAVDLWHVLAEALGHADGLVLILPHAAPPLPNS